MTFGSYISAAGMLTSSHRIDVLANNLANADSNGFRRSLAIMSERPTPKGNDLTGSPEGMLRDIGGGHWMAPTRLDRSQGPLESTGNPLDMAIVGDGFFEVQHPQGRRLTRDGAMMIDDQGYLVLATNTARKILDVDGNTIQLSTADRTRLDVSKEGVIIEDGKPKARVAVVSAPTGALSPAGGNLLQAVDDSVLKPVDQVDIKAGFVEGANLDAATELTQLMEAQRQLEANANMLKMADESVGRAIQAGRL